MSKTNLVKHGLGLAIALRVDEARDQFENAGCARMWQQASEQAALGVKILYRTAEANHLFHRVRMKVFREIMIDLKILTNQDFRSLEITDAYNLV